MIEDGKPLKPWFLESLDDEKIPEIEDYHGKPLLILFYYLGCPGCKGRALPFANRMVVEHPDLQVIGIHTRFEGPSYTDEQIREANQEFFVRFPIYRDMEPARTFWDYRAGGTPHWILVNQNGIVKQNIFGSDPNKALLRLDLSITELLQT